VETEIDTNFARKMWDGMGLDHWLREQLGMGMVRAGTGWNMSPEPF